MLFDSCHHENNYKELSKIVKCSPQNNIKDLIGPNLIHTIGLLVIIKWMFISNSQTVYRYKSCKVAKENIFARKN